MISDFHTPETSFLSNFYPCNVAFDGVVYPSVEHAYQASKTDDLKIREQMRTGTAGSAKRRARRLGLTPAENKLGIMERLLQQKFSIPSLKRKLLATGVEGIEELNTWGDVFWGMTYKSAGFTGKRKVGQNHLGKLLMKIRFQLSQEKFK